MTVKKLIAKLEEMPLDAEVKIVAFDPNDTMITNDMDIVHNRKDGTIQLIGA